jgi:hypothetical protein
MALAPAEIFLALTAFVQEIAKQLLADAYIHLLLSA